jgi:hypothetical protein
LRSLLYVIYMRVRNDIIFNKKSSFHFLQVIHMMTHWVLLWALLSPEGQRYTMISEWIQFQTVAQDMLGQVDNILGDYNDVYCMLCFLIWLIFISILGELLNLRLINKMSWSRAFISFRKNSWRSLPPEGRFNSSLS